MKKYAWFTVTTIIGLILFLFLAKVSIGGAIAGFIAFTYLNWRGDIDIHGRSK
jgi:hypothetical protein